MSDRLEDFVKSNREAFDLNEPDPSLWLRVNPDNKRIRKRTRLIWLRNVAAITLIIAGFSAGAYYLIFGGTVNRNLQGELSREIMETEVYYNQLINGKYNELKTYLLDDQETHDMLFNDMEELNEIYNDLKKDLNDNVANPEVIEAMIQNYRIKLEILEDLLSQLKEKENQDYEKEESVSL